MRGMVLAMGLAATASQAQEFPAVIDMDVVQACLDNADPVATAPQCIGAAASACMEQPLGSSTQGISLCLGAETEIWDGYLNSEYKARMVSITADQKAALKAAQRAWMAFRDADCALQYQMFIDGTIRSNIHAGCLLDKTARRTFALRDLGNL